MPRPERHTRDSYHAIRPITTRWMDNDVYAHVNNVVYYAFFDTVVNAYLIGQKVLDFNEGEVIVVTGFPSVDTAKEAIRLGACDYLAKPLAPCEVIEAANSAIERKHWTLRREGEGARQVNGSNDGAAQASGNAS